MTSINTESTFESAIIAHLTANGWHVGRQLTADAKANGPGNNYLIQHYAGSGKSNSIAWLAYRLSGLYYAQDKKVYDSIIVITDRNVLDQQLQNTIYQFEHKQGVVQRIEIDSKQLAGAIKTETNIIITTLQKFPYASNHLGETPDRNYAVIIDEAHSSQGGESSRKGVTESHLNGFGELEFPGKFATDDYQVLLVADKYQYGFDQPMLHTMYVDKKLSGVRAVQTLSRINRTHPGKEDTFVLDFANDRQTIIDSFQPYYELTTVAEPTDPNHLYDLKGRMDAANVYYQSEVDAFARVFYKPGSSSIKDQVKMYAYIDPAVDRFKALEEEPQDEFKKSMTSYVRLYSFLSQIMPFQDAGLEKLYSYGRFLLSKLPKSDYTERLKTG